MGEAEAVIEAVVERVGPKKEHLGALDALLPPGSLLLTNTSSISITDLASTTAGRRGSAEPTSSPRRPLGGRRDTARPADERRDRGEGEGARHFLRQAASRGQQVYPWFRGEPLPHTDAHTGGAAPGRGRGEQRGDRPAWKKGDRVPVFRLHNNKNCAFTSCLPRMILSE